MKIFISHSHTQARDADALALALRNAGHDAVLDRDLLEGGDEYIVKLRQALQSSDLFLFMITPESVRPGCFALTEMASARERWPSPAGHVLPVMWQETPLATVPEYLKSPSILPVAGNAVAETVARVVDIAAQRRAAKMRRQGLALGGVLLLGVAATLAWRARLPPPDPPACLLRAVLLPPPTQQTTVDAGLPGRLRPFVVAGDGVAQLDIAGLTAGDTPWSITVSGTDGQAVARFTVNGCPQQPQELVDGPGPRVRLEPRR